MSKNLPKLLKISDAAKFLGWDKRSLWRLVSLGEIPAHKLGGVWFITREALDKLVSTSKEEVQ